MSAGETVAEMKALYRRRVDISDGISLTGFMSSYNVGPNVNAGNNAYIILLEDYPFDLQFEITATGYHPFALFQLRESFATESFQFKEQFNTPYQLRYGHEYILVAYITLGAALVGPPVNSFLTAFGFENSQETQARVELR